MPALVNANGELKRPEEAFVSVYDRGFLYGDSVYETFRTYDGLPWLLDAHLGRLQRSADRIGLVLPGGPEGVRAQVARTLDAAGERNAAVRIVVTRGAVAGRVDLDPFNAGPPALYVLARPFEGLPAGDYEHGVDVVLAGTRRNSRLALDPAVKSGNYLNNVMGLREARARGAFECLMLNPEGLLAEGSTSNVFLVQGGTLRTPALDAGLLPGVTRACVLDLAREAGVPAREEPLTVQDIERADEMFLSASLKEIVPIRAVDGKPVGDGTPGVVTRDLRRRYLERIRAAIPGA